MARIQILSIQEEILFSKPPSIDTNQEKDYYFNIPQILKQQILNFKNDTNIIVFILLYGYFKATNKFFDNNLFKKDDIEFVEHKHNYKYNKTDNTNIKIHTIKRYKKSIKESLGIQPLTKKLNPSLPFNFTKPLI